MSTELQQTNVVQLRAELNNIRSQADLLLGRLAGVEQRLSIIEQPKTGPRGVANNGKPLADFIVEVLQNSNEPLTAKEIADLVLDAGYNTVDQADYEGENQTYSLRSGRVTKVK